MEMGAEQGSGICTEGAGERESLLSISFVKGISGVFFLFVITGGGKEIGSMYARKWV